MFRKVVRCYEPAHSAADREAILPLAALQTAAAAALHSQEETNDFICRHRKSQR